MEMYLIIFCVGVLGVCAVFGLMVGVSNDAVNFLNASLGSKVTSRKNIMIIASLGILAGVLFSSGMMEVARKGIVNPSFFTMPELVVIFLSVMLTDIILLDLFNTFGLPTSTTVSIVFELLGAAVAVSIYKIIQADQSIASIASYINSSKALMIILGILFSVIIAFICGAIVMFITRYLFTFDYMVRLKRYGALWGGVALAFITFFIVVKGAKGTSFLTEENIIWVKNHTLHILGVCFVCSSILLYLLQRLFDVNILKPIILIGTFALAMSFAANDLVNFIGVPLAGYQAFLSASATANPLTASMGILAKQIPTNNFLLLLAGSVMILTMWLSKKIRTVSRTELSLGSQDEGFERFDAAPLSRIIVRIFHQFFGTTKKIIPGFIRASVEKRIDPSQGQSTKTLGQSFDLFRASVNLLVASVIISYATSFTLPISTTYVTFMVSMGSSFADKAWGRETAVYRITGVLTVIGGWFMTAVMAFIGAFILAITISCLGLLSAVGVVALVVLMAIASNRKHKQIEKENADTQVMNISHVTNVEEIVTTTFGHLKVFLASIRISLNNTMLALFQENETKLKLQRKEVKKIQDWANIIIANMFKALRELQKEALNTQFKYTPTIRCLQNIAESQRDIVIRAYLHVANQHKGLIPDQIDELKELVACLDDILITTEHGLQNLPLSLNTFQKKHEKLENISNTLAEKQLDRIVTRQSKTRRSIMYYAIIGNMLSISKHNMRLVNIVNNTYEGAQEVIQGE